MNDVWSEKMYNIIFYSIMRYIKLKLEGGTSRVFRFGAVDLLVLGHHFQDGGAFGCPDAASGVRIYSLRKPYPTSSSKYL